MRVNRRKGMQERSKRRKAQRSKSRNRKTLLSVTVVLGTCLIAGAVYAGTLYYKAERALDRISASGTTPSETASPTSPMPGASAEADAADAVDENKPLTFLLVNCGQPERQRRDAEYGCADLRWSMSL